MTTRTASTPQRGTHIRRKCRIYSPVAAVLSIPSCDENRKRFWSSLQGRATLTTFVSRQSDPFCDIPNTVHFDWNKDPEETIVTPLSEDNHNITIALVAVAE